ncbi:MAG: hypothetical protein AABZ15_14735 [Nitrospirota bacterium]
MQSLIDRVNSLFNHKRFNLLAAGVIAAMVLIAYSNTFTASFHFDDNPAIIENATIRHITVENIGELIQGLRPVVYLSLMLNYAVSGLNVVGWHMFNIGIHIVNSVFVYFLLLWTLSMPVLGGKYEDRAKRMALFAALLFGVHPIQTESVTYIISRTELLATCFYLATFLLFIKGARSGKFGYTIGMFITAVLSMGSKEWAVTLPAVLLVYDILFIAEGKVRPVLGRWLMYAVVTVPWYIVLKSLNLFTPGGSAGIGFSIQSPGGLNAQTYFLTSMNVIWTYVRLLFLPINQNLDYEYPVAKTLFELPTIISFLGHLVVTIGAFMLYRRRTLLLIPFGVAWFYIGLSPTQSVVPIIDVIFEHRVYMPSIGFFIVFVVAYEELFAWWEKRKAPVALAGQETR